MSFDKYYRLNLEETKRKIKESVIYDDFIVQSVNNISEIGKTANTLVKRLREWYELSNPEFSREIADNEVFVSLLLTGKDTKKNGSMGADLTKEDYEPILRLAKDINSLFTLKHKQEEYLEKLMNKHCPNMTAVAGYLVGAKLIALAGKMKRLIMFPASTVQLLGAEKALFRHMKTGARSPKHGIIHEHPLISRVGAKDKGKAARILADKILIAAKIDYFKGKFIGNELRKEAEARFN